MARPSAAHVALCFAVWYGSSITNNLSTKALLAEGFAFPAFSAMLGAAAQVAALVVKRAIVPEAPPSKPGAAPHGPTFGALAALSLCATAATLFHRFALMGAPIAVVHTVKSLTCVATALLGRAVSGQPWPSSAALALVVFGVFAATQGDVLLGGRALQWSAVVGAAPALVCVWADSVRAVFGKPILQHRPTATLIKVQALSFALLAVYTVVAEGPRLADRLAAGPPPAILAASVVSVAAMELGSYWALTLFPPVIHSMANTVRSLVVIACGALVGAALPGTFYAGCATSLVGVMLHSYRGAQMREAALRAAKTD